MTIWREAQERDYAGIQACHRETCQKLGAAYDLPPYRDSAILGWFVAERDDQIVQFYLLEKVIEFRMGGEDMEALQQLIAEFPAVKATIRRAGLRWIHCPVPEKVEESTGRHLAEGGFRRSPNTLFAVDLRGEQ